jgi:hypothetical protein
MRFFTIFQIYFLTRILITCGFFFNCIGAIVTEESFDQLANYFSSSLFHSCLAGVSALIIFWMSWKSSLSVFMLADFLCILFYRFFPTPMRSLVFMLAKDREIRKYIETLTLSYLAQEKSLLDEDYRISWNNRICLKSSLYKVIKQKLAIKYRFKGILREYKHFFVWLLLETALHTWIDCEEI